MALSPTYQPPVVTLQVWRCPKGHLIEPGSIRFDIADEVHGVEAEGFCAPCWHLTEAREGTVTSEDLAIEAETQLRAVIGALEEVLNAMRISMQHAPTSGEENRR